MTVLALVPMRSSKPTPLEHGAATHAFLETLVHLGLLEIDVRWSPTKDMWVMVFLLQNSLDPKEIELPCGPSSLTQTSLATRLLPAPKSK